MQGARIYFIADPFVAEFYYAQIRQRNEGIIVHTYRNFNEYFDRIISQYSEESFISISFYFYKLNEILNKQLIKKEMINLVVEQGINNIRVDFVPIDNPYSSNYERHDNLPIIEQWVRGIDIKLDTDFRDKIFERACKLQEFKEFYAWQGYMNLNEFLDSLGANILKYFSAKHANIALWEKVNANPVLFKKAFCEVPLQNYEPPNVENGVLREEIKQVDKIKNESLANELRSLGIKHRVLVPIHSQYAYGYLDFFTTLDEISSTEYAQMKLISKQICLVIDNTFFFQHILKTSGSTISIFDDIEDAILVVDKNRIVVDINEACEKLTGWSRKEAVGKPCKLLWHSCDFYGTSMCDTKHCPMLIPLLEKRATTRQKVYTLDKAGEKKIVKSDYSISRNVIGNIDYGVAIVRDLTERVQLEDKLQRFEQLAALGKFATELAHEIRNPVTGISSNAQFLYEESKLDKNYRKIAKEIFQSASAIEATVKKFLNLGHPPVPSLSETKINQLIKKAIGILRKKMDRTGIELDISFGKYLPRIKLDHDLIQQVFINIIMNSIEAMEEGGTLKVKTSLRQKGRPKDQEGKYIEVTLSDTGCGIPANVLDKIFDPFFTTKPAGSGLGLYTTYKIITNHDASIEVRSLEGKGTKTFINFRVTH